MTSFRSLRVCVSLNRGDLMRKRKDMKEYRIWKAMKARCYAPCNANMGYYQKEHITVCERWRNNFPAFLEDMGHIPGDDYSIDRIDNAKGYSPENCRWIPFRHQSRNRRNIMLITYRGKTRPLKEWAHRLKLKYHTLYGRLSKGIPFEQAISNEPVRFVEINGRRQYISDWCKEIGVSATAVYSWKHRHNATAKEALLHYMREQEEKQNDETERI